MGQNKTELNELGISLDASVNPPLKAAINSAAEATPSYSMAYNEMADFPVQMIDPVEEVQKNLAHLQELERTCVS